MKKLREYADRARAAAALSRKSDELLYEQALNEFESNDIRRGLWAQALAEAQGDEVRAKGSYLKLRVRAMVDEGALIREAANELDRRYSADAVAQGVTQQSEVKWRSTEDELAGISGKSTMSAFIFLGLAILVALLAIASLG